jgi:NAD(P)-dependent dehydrogenase (short-subunit alcohol dehydrogenase family)
MNDFSNCVALVTGAASGIGRQLALSLAAEGARVAALDRSADGLDTLAAELRGRPLACATADVTDLEGLRAAVAKLEEQLGPTDLLLASAGIGRETSALDFRAEDVAEQVRVNLIGVANSIDAVLAGMRRRRRGHLVALSSLASYRGLPRMAGYCASKAGLNALLDALRVELRPEGIAVTTVCPGWVRTPLTAPLDLNISRMMEVEEAVRHILWAVRRRRSFLAFPAASAWQVRLLRYLPGGVSDWMTHRYLLRHTKK